MLLFTRALFITFQNIYFCFLIRWKQSKHSSYVWTKTANIEHMTTKLRGFCGITTHRNGATTSAVMVNEKNGAKWTERIEYERNNREWDRKVQSREGWSKGVTVRTQGNIALTQTMRSLERSFQGLRKAYNPVYRPRKSGDIYSSAFASPIPLRAHRHPPFVCRETWVVL